MDLHYLRVACLRHAVEHPTHGINCACMDTHIREVRAKVRIGDIFGDPGEVAAKNAQQRVDYVLSMAGRS
jgi:hypothetical protein